MATKQQRHFLNFRIQKKKVPKATRLPIFAFLLDVFQKRFLTQNVFFPLVPWSRFFPLGWTPLHVAAEKGHEAVTEQLLAAQAAVEARNSDGPGARRSLGWQNCSTNWQRYFGSKKVFHKRTPIGKNKTNSVMPKKVRYSKHWKIKHWTISIALYNSFEGSKEPTAVSYAPETRSLIFAAIVIGVERSFDRRVLPSLAAHRRGRKSEDQRITQRIDV